MKDWLTGCPRRGRAKGWTTAWTVGAVFLAGCSGSVDDGSGLSAADTSAAGGSASSPIDDGTSLGSGGSSSAESGGVTAGSGGAGGFAGGGNTNVSLGGAQDFGFFRKLLDEGQVPHPDEFDAAGFFAEHHTELPEPACGERICLQPMLGVMGNLLDGNNCTMLQLGLNSPIVADPSQRPPLNLAVVVDVSGSMSSGDKIEFVQDGLHMLLDGLRDTDKFSLVTYSDNAEVPFPMDSVELNRATIREIVDSLTAAGGTNLYDGLERGFTEAMDHHDGGRQNRVILLSDGQPTAGITSEDSILEMSKGYNSDGVGLTTIGLGSDFNVNLMRNLALQADGNFYFLENSGAVSEVFQEELSYFTVPIAFDLEVAVAAGSPYELRRAYGTPFWTDTTSGGRLDVPSVFLAHRESDTDQTDSGGRRGGGSALLVELMPQSTTPDDSSAGVDVATIDISFREPGTDDIITDQVTVGYPYPAWETPETGYFDSPDLSVVHKSFVMLNLYVGIERATRAFHESGDTTENVAMLERLVAAVVDYNEEVGDADIASDVDLVEQLIDVLITNGVPEPAEPMIPQDPWPAD